MRREDGGLVMTVGLGYGTVSGLGARAVGGIDENERHSPGYGLALLVEVNGLLTGCLMSTAAVLAVSMELPPPMARMTSALNSAPMAAASSQFA